HPLAADATTPSEREKVVVEVGGKRLEVSLPADFGAATTGGSHPPAPRRRSSQRQTAKADGDALTAPMQGTIVKVMVADGDEVVEGDPVVVLEAMKMEQPLAAHRSGKVTDLKATVGEVVQAGATICRIT